MAGYYDALRGATEPSRRVGWRSRLGQAARYEAAAAFIDAGDAVLDVGCGLADLFGYLDARGPSVSYRGVDVDSRLVAEAQARHPTANIALADYRTDPLPEADVVVAIGALVSGASLADESLRKEMLLSMARATFAAARKRAVLIVLRQEFLSARPAFAAEPALAGARETEPSWLAESVGAAHHAAVDVVATDRAIVLSRAPVSVAKADYAQRAVDGPIGRATDPIEQGWFWLAADRPDRARAATARVDLSTSMAGRFLRDSLSDFGS